MSVQPREPLVGEELARLLELIRGANSVELKLTVPDDSQRSTIAALGVDPLEAQIRQVFFFDTPDLALSEAGVVARVRRIQGREADSVVKLRPVVPDELPDEVRGSSSFVVEVDAMPGGYVCSASLKGKVRCGRRPEKRLRRAEAEQAVLGRPTDLLRRPCPRRSLDR